MTEKRSEPLFAPSNVGKPDRFLAHYAAMLPSDPHSQQDSLREPVSSAETSNSLSGIDVAAGPVSVPDEAPGETIRETTREATDSSTADSPALAREIGGREGPEPTRFGDWEKGGRCIDF